MSPQAFNFKLTVPNDPDGATVAAVVATHAAEYAGLSGDAGPAFVERVRTAALQVLKGGTGSTLIVFTATDGRLVVTIGATAVSEPLPA
jgi:hypothetical protein